MNAYPFGDVFLGHPGNAYRWSPVGKGFPLSNFDKILWRKPVAYERVHVQSRLGLCQELQVPQVFFDVAGVIVRGFSYEMLVVFPRRI